MKYGRKDVRKRRREIAGKAVARSHRAKALLLLAAVVLIGVGIAFAGRTVYAYVKGVIAEAPDISEVDATPSGYMSTVLDADGNVTATLVSEGSNRVYVTIDEIPVDLQHAFVAIEDERFYEHNGIDIQGIIRAGYQAVITGSLSEGASTITQQLLKNNVFEGWTSETAVERIERKIQEQYLATELEKLVSKDWIMENYLNTINLGQNTLGVQAAANRYFGKDVSDLTLSECAVLAAITQNPSAYNPITYPEANAERRAKVLENMLEQGYITEEEYNEALEDDVYTRIAANNSTYVSTSTNVTSYFVDALTDQVIEDLQEELGYTEAEAYNALYSGGLTIYSTQDPEIQEICDSVMSDSSYYDSTEISFSYSLTIQNEDGSTSTYSEQDMLEWLEEEKDVDDLNYSSEEAAAADISEYRAYILSLGGTSIGESVTYTLQPQASMTIIDQSTGHVVALVGGRGEKTASKTLNRASDTTVQPGSTFKILTAYAAALNEGVLTLASMLNDEEITYESGQVIGNADGTYHGTVTVRTAIAKSYNVIAIKASREVGLETCYQYALNFGISTLIDEDLVEALPLGGITYGVTNVELAAAYAAIANGGTYNKPVYYTQVVDSEGNVLLDTTDNEGTQVISEETAFLLTSAMEDVVESGTGTKANFDGMSIAGKTGTTSNTRASWFVGYTPYYTCAVWGGYDDNSTLSSTDFTKYLWKAAMSQIHEGLEDIGFDQPETIVTARICTSSGNLASSACTSVITEYFTEDTVPTNYCSSHQYVTICTESGLLAGEYCPSECRQKLYYTSGSSSVPTSYCTIHTESSETEEETEGESAEQSTDTGKGESEETAQETE